MGAKVSGIYAWTSPSGKQYVGSAVNLRSRRKDHCVRLRAGRHKNVKLQRAWNKYGEANIRFSVLLVCSPEMLIFYEQRAMDALNPAYNICLVAGSMLGVRKSEETKKKHSVAMRGRKPAQSTIDAVRRSSLGRQISEETRAKRSSALKGNKNALGHKQSPEHIRKSTSHFIGKKKPPEEIERALATRRANAEKRGYWVSPEAIEKTASANRGKRHSPEHCAKIAAAGKARRDRLAASVST